MGELKELAIQGTETIPYDTVMVYAYRYIYQNPQKVQD